MFYRFSMTVDIQDSNLNPEDIPAEMVYSAFLRKIGYLMQLPIPTAIEVCELETKEITQ